MKFPRIHTVILWACVLGSVLSMSNAVETITTPEIRLSNATRIDTGTEAAQKRSKRYTYFPWTPYNTCIALAIVLAIPLELKGRNVYMSYNFETNFYIPYFDTTQGLVPLPWATIDAAAVNSGTIQYYEQGGETRKLQGEADAEESQTESNQNTTVENNSESTTELPSTSSEKSQNFKGVSFRDSNATEHASKEHEKPKQFEEKTKKTQKQRVNREILTTLLSRKKLYKMLEHKLDIAGLNGEECLLKAICETAEQPFAEHNGVLGDIMHIIFTPTASRDEKLPKRYYEAITDGESGRCRYYNTLCPKGIFDLITKTILQ